MTHPLARTMLLIATFFTAMFFGLMVCFLIVVDRMLATLDATTYTQVMQQLIHAADHPPLVPLMVMISVITPLVYLVLERKHAQSLSYKLVITSLILFTIAFLVTVVLNVPLNTQISSWIASNPPANWSAIRNQWHSYNIIRVLTTGTAFILYLWVWSHGFSNSSKNA